MTVYVLTSPGLLILVPTGLGITCAAAAAGAAVADEM